jgi:hypothetical protein
MPKTTRVFSMVGYSTRNGVRRVRVTSRGPIYQAVLEEEGDTDIEMYQLPHMMSKPQAKAWLKAKFAEAVEAVFYPPVPVMTQEEAMAILPKRNRKGHPIKKAVLAHWAGRLIGAV